MRTSSKVQDIESLARLLASSDGKKVVQCQGVFDPLHIGHIRHFKQARALGDILVVVVTPDRYVNKGPHRPVFGEQLRAESIAALECVDYVTINRWPTAVEAIRLLRPHLYVKGPDYRDASLDHTGAIALEEAAIREVGGELTFTDGVTYSSSHLVNHTLPVFSDGLRDYLAGFTARYSTGDIIRCIEGMRPLKVLVVGEAIIDEYHYCQAIGKSSKEPMLALKHLSLERFAGGILAVGNHVANFCDKVGMLTVLGAENPQEDFIRANLDPKINPTFIYQHDRPTIVKKRFIDSYFFTKLLEVYEFDDREPTDLEDQALCQALQERLPAYDVVLVVDFGHGILSQEAIQVLRRGASFLAVNAQTNAGNMGYNNISKYAGADFLCMAEHEIRLEARDRHGDLKSLIQDLSDKVGSGCIAVTRGSNGCICYSSSEGFFEVPAFAGKVLDRMGAGDAFLSVASLCVAQKTPMDMVGFIGNAVGALAVATVGNRQPVERVALLKYVESLVK